LIKESEEIQLELPLSHPDQPNPVEKSNSHPSQSVEQMLEDDELGTNLAGC
jgi:hypothetical protein